MKRAEQRGLDETLVALYTALLPMARIMVRGRLSARELIQAAKLAYVDAVISEVIPSGSKINVSTIAVVSGLTRKEIASLLHRSSNKGRAGEKRFVQQRTIRVIHGWKVDPLFQTAKGKPRDLPTRGRQRSFQLLVKKHGGDVTPTSVLRELERMQAVTRSPKGLVRLKSRAMQSTQHATQQIVEFSRLLRDFSNTLQQVSAPEKPALFFAFKDAKVSSVNQAALFKQTFSRRSAALLEGVDQWLAHQRRTKSDGRDRSGRKTRVGVGVYLIQEEER